MLGSVTMVRRWTTALWVLPVAERRLEVDARTPPNPNEAEMGRRSHLGAFLSEIPGEEDARKSGLSKRSPPSARLEMGAAWDSFSLDWRELMEIFPSKEAVARISGFRGLKEVWKAQLLLAGS